MGVAAAAHRPVVSPIVNVLVTGASSGIGAALARRLAERGATVGLVGRRRDKLEAVLAECQVSTPTCRSWVIDLGDLDAAEWVADVEDTMRVNFLAPARMTLALLGRMLERGSGTIVNVSSLGGRLGIAHEAAYCASKFALAGWSEGLAIDLDGTGVRVRLINPGPIDTDIWDRPGEDPAVFIPPLESPNLVADGIIAAIEGDAFEHYLPDMKPVVDYKNSDIDGYITMNAEFTRAQAKEDR
jgi:short-subunit dehydrogenase